jgi:hypothetical protein
MRRRDKEKMQGGTGVPHTARKRADRYRVRLTIAWMWAQGMQGQLEIRWGYCSGSRAPHTGEELGLISLLLSLWVEIQDDGDALNLVSWPFLNIGVRNCTVACKTGFPFADTWKLFFPPSSKGLEISLAKTGLNSTGVLEVPLWGFNRIVGNPV